MSRCSDEISTCTDGAASKVLGCSLTRLDDGHGTGVNEVKENTEPNTIANYKTTNYFSQAASDATIYRNTEENFDGQSNCYVDENMIDLRKLLRQTIQKLVNSRCKHSQKSKDTKGKLDVKPSEYLQVKDKVGTPEYIDISKLRVPVEHFSCPAPPSLKRKRLSKRNRRWKRRRATTTSTNQIDDEVILVKKDEARFNNPLDSSSAKTVQLLTGSTDDALKLSDTDIYHDTRRNSPSALSVEGFKGCPAEEMHEKSVFDEVIKKIIEVDMPKPCRSPAKDKEVAKSTPRKRRAARQKSKKADASKTNEPNKEFTGYTYETLQEVIGYVLRLKEYNKIEKHGKTPEDEHNEDEVRKEEINGKGKEDFIHAAQILANTCILYSLNNGVSQADVAHYLNNFKKEDHLKE